MTLLLYIVVLALICSGLFMSMFLYLELKGWLRKRRGLKEDWSNLQVWKYNPKTQMFEKDD